MTIPYKIGDVLYIQQRLLLSGEPLIYKARISNLTEDCVAIEMPLNQETGKYGFFPTGSEVDVWLDCQDGSRYQFICHILGRKKEEIPLTLMTLPIPGSMTRTQRREFIRVPCYEDVALHPSNNGTMFSPFLVKAIDISGGGLAFSLTKKPAIQEGTTLKWYIALPLLNGRITHSLGQGKLVRVIEPSENGLPYKCSLQFTEIVEVERQKIMRFCFERQLEIRKKGIQI